MKDSETSLWAAEFYVTADDFYLYVEHLSDEQLTNIAAICTNIGIEILEELRKRGK